MSAACQTVSSFEDLHTLPTMATASQFVFDGGASDDVSKLLAPPPPPPPPLPWKIRPCEVQPDESSIARTHNRQMPLPFAIKLDMGRTSLIRCQYIGHGRNKVTFLLENETRVLKVAKVGETEPHVCKALLSRSEGETLCPEVYEISACLEFDALSQLKCEWLAWIAQYALPLDKILQLPEIDREACTISALYVQARSAQLGLGPINLRDNLGVLMRSDGAAKPRGAFTLATDKQLWYAWLTENLSCVVILGTGSRPLLKAGTVTKGVINTTAIKKWWNKLRWQAKEASDWEETKRLWSEMHTIDGLVDCLRTRHYCRVAKPSAAKPVHALLQC